LGHDRQYACAGECRQLLLNTRMELTTGKLVKQLVWLQRTGFTSDPNTNQQLAAFAAGVTFYGAVIPLTADERIWGQDQQSLLSHKVICRWFADVVERDHITYARFFPDGTTSTTTLEIAGVIDTEEAHRELVILCKEVR
jgi:head-tail adaptor